MFCLDIRQKNDRCQQFSVKPIEKNHLIIRVLVDDTLLNACKNKYERSISEEIY